MVAWPVKPLTTGTNRTLSVERSKSAFVTDAVAIVVHVVPPSRENCQLPLAVPVSPVIAIPWKAPRSGSVTALPRRSATVAPAGLVVPLGTSGRAGLPLVSRTGASLTGTTLTIRVTAALEFNPSVTVNDRVRGAFVGPSEVFRYLTDRNTAWYTAVVAVPVRVSTPVPAS